jgi:hypothetical protein
MSAKAEKIVRDQLEERMVAGSVRMETDPKKLAALLDDRVDQDLRDLRTGPPRALDYANVIDALLARAELEGISHQEIESTRVARIAARGSFRGGMVWTPPDPVFHIMHEVPGRIRLRSRHPEGRCHSLRSRRGVPVASARRPLRAGQSPDRKPDGSP